jgi:hypothetical protein
MHEAIRLHCQRSVRAPGIIAEFNLIHTGCEKFAIVPTCPRRSRLAALKAQPPRASAVQPTHTSLTFMIVDKGEERMVIELRMTRE